MKFTLDQIRGLAAFYADCGVQMYDVPWGEHRYAKIGEVLKEHILLRSRIADRRQDLSRNIAELERKEQPTAEETYGLGQLKRELAELDALERDGAQLPREAVMEVCPYDDEFVIFRPAQEPGVTMVVRKSRVKEGIEYFSLMYKRESLEGAAKPPEGFGTCLSAADIDFINAHSTIVRLERDGRKWRLKSATGKWDGETAERCVKELNDALEAEKAKKAKAANGGGDVSLLEVVGKACDALNKADTLINGYCPNPALEGDERRVDAVRSAFAYFRNLRMKLEEKAKGGE